MSSARSQERWLLLAPLTALIVVVGGVGAFLWITNPPEPESSSRPGMTEQPRVARMPRRTSPERPPLEQAPWRIKTFPVAKGGDFTKDLRKSWLRQRPKIEKVVRGVYDELFLDGRAGRGELRDDFANGSGRALLDSAAGLPRGARRVETVRRSARIGVTARRPTRAAAQVVIGVKGLRLRRSFRLRHRSTLWLERDGGRWRVIAFEIDQVPATKA